MSFFSNLFKKDKQKVKEDSKDSSERRVTFSMSKNLERSEMSDHSERDDDEIAKLSEDDDENNNSNDEQNLRADPVVMSFDDDSDTEEIQTNPILGNKEIEEGNYGKQVVEITFDSDSEDEDKTGLFDTKNDQESENKMLDNKESNESNIIIEAHEAYKYFENISDDFKKYSLILKSDNVNSALFYLDNYFRETYDFKIFKFPLITERPTKPFDSSSKFAIAVSIACSYGCIVEIKSNDSNEFCLSCGPLSIVGESEDKVVNEFVKDVENNVSYCSLLENRMISLWDNSEVYAVSIYSNQSDYKKRFSSVFDFYYFRSERDNELIVLHENHFTIFNDLEAAKSFLNLEDKQLTDVKSEIRKTTKILRLDPRASLRLMLWSVCGLSTEHLFAELTTLKSLSLEVAIIYQINEKSKKMLKKLVEDDKKFLRIQELYPKTRLLS